MSSSHPFSWPQWSQLSATRLAELVRQREVGAAEVAAQAHAAALRVEPELQAIVELLDAPVAAPDVDVDEQGLLAGVPMLLKDLGSSVAGMLRENGSALHRGERVARTDPLPARWLAEGAQVIGRATTAELGMGYDTSTVYRGLQVTRNPWNTALTAGGSSGGSAALVAAGVVPLTHATDGAGSIRQPAALNGVYGLKVSRARLPLPWHVNELLNTSMVEGVFARGLDDVALALDAATARPAPLGKFFGAPPAGAPSRARAALALDAPRLRVGFTTDSFGRAGACEPERAERVRDAARRLAADGHVVEELPASALPDFARLWSSFETFWAGMRAASWQLAHGETLPPRALAALSPMVRAYWDASARYGKGDVMRYLAGNVHIALDFGRLLERHDVLLLPVVPYATPPANGPLSPAVEHPFDAFVQGFLDAGRYTIPANEAGLPALAVPAGLDAQGMPLAVQLYGRWHGEEALLQAGRALERALGTQGGTPRVHVAGPPV